VVLSPTSTPTPSPIPTSAPTFTSAVPALATPTRIVLPRPTLPAVLCVEVITGDTLTDIARTFDVDPAVLVDWNKRKFPSLLTHPDLLEVGWVLCMPVGFNTNTPSPKSTP